MRLAENDDFVGVSDRTKIIADMPCKMAASMPRWGMA